MALSRRMKINLVGGALLTPFILYSALCGPDSVPEPTPEAVAEATPESPPPADATPDPPPEALSLEELFTGMVDYEPPAGEFTVLSAGTHPHIRVGAATVDGEPADVRLANTRRAAVDAVLLALTFTDLDGIQVTARPLQIAPKAPTKPLGAPLVVLEVTREDATAFLKEHGVDGFGALRLGRSALEAQYKEPITPEAYAKLPTEMKFAADATQRFVFDSQGPPGLTGTVAAFQKR